MEKQSLCLESLQSRFPKIELFYETINHKKVVANDEIVMSIPYGKKVYAWFTYHKSDCVCIIVSYDKSKHIIADAKIVPSYFNRDLCLGTILYGTIISYKDNRYFCIEDLCYYKHKRVVDWTFSRKLELLHYVLQNEMSQKPLMKSDIIFGLPIITKTIEDVQEYSISLPYNVYAYQFRNLRKQKSQPQQLVKQRDLVYTNNFAKSPKMVFRITAKPQDDVYTLHCYHRGDVQYEYDTAYIPDYKTSVFMNSIFRKIRENDNLDYLEESDDEDEFENTDEAKYLIPNKYMSIICAFHYRFKKWVPIEISRNRKTCNLNQLRDFIRNGFVIANEGNKRNFL
jgi:hypothetical protein